MMKRYIFKAILSYFIFAATIFAAGEEKYAPITNFTGGLNSQYSSLSIADDEVQDALNVWFDEDSSVVKRKGFSTYATTTTVRFTNGWSYTDSSNNNWIVTLASDSIRASSGDGIFSIVVATVPTPTNSLVDAVSAFGNIYFVDSVQGVYFWNGTSTTYVSGSPKGSLICEFKGRLWVAGEAHPDQNRLSASGHLAPTSWTSGSLATDPIVFIIGLTDKSDGITSLYSGLNDAIYIFKRNSIHALYGFDQDDFQARVLTSESGCIQGKTVQPFAGGLLFLSKRGFEIFDGVSPRVVSKKINNQLQNALLSSFAQKSWTQDIKADWDAGTIAPTGNLSTTITDGSVVLSTQVAISFTDTLTADFGTGTFSNTTSTQTTDSVQLIYSSVSPNSCSNSGSAGNSCSPATYASFYQSFTASDSFLLQTITLGLYKEGSPGNYSLRILSDSAFSPGSVLSSVVVSPASVGASPGGNYTFSIPNIALTSGVRYWIALVPTGTCDFINAIYNINTLTVCNGTSEKYCGGSACTTTREQTFSIGGIKYPAAGTFISRSFDVGFTTSTWRWSWGNFTANSTLNGQTITYQTQTASSTTGTWDALTTTMTSTVQRYIRYKASFSTTDITVTPVLHAVTLETSAFRKPYGYHTSQIYNIGSDITSFGSFDVLSDLSASGTLDFTLCTSSSSSMSPKVCANQTPSNLITVSTNAYTHVITSFTITSATQNPILQNFVVKWNVGSRSPTFTSAIHDERYWVSLTTSSLSNGNDSTFVMSYNLNRDKFIWTKHDINAGAYIIYKDELYHADSNATGKVYKDIQNYNDAGNVINAYFVTKDFVFDGIHIEKVFDGLWVVSDALGNYDLSTSYCIDRFSTNEFSLDTVSLDEQNGLIDIKLPFPIDSTHQVFGKSIAFKFSNNVLDSPMRVYGGILGYYVRKPE